MATLTLDENVLKQFSPTQLTTYFSVYLKNARQLVEGIQKDMDNRNFEIMKARAHKLKGSSVTIGAVEMKECAHTIEDRIKSGGEIEQPDVDKVKECFTKLTQYLQEKHNIAG